MSEFCYHHTVRLTEERIGGMGPGTFYHDRVCPRCKATIEVET